MSNAGSLGSDFFGHGIGIGMFIAQWVADNRFTLGSQLRLTPPLPYQREHDAENGSQAEGHGTDGTKSYDQGRGGEAGGTLLLLAVRRRAGRRGLTPIVARLRCWIPVAPLHEPNQNVTGGRSPGAWRRFTSFSLRNEDMMALPLLDATRIVVCVARIEAPGTAATLVVLLVAAHEDSPLSILRCACTSRHTAPNRSTTKTSTVARLVDRGYPVATLFQINPTLHSGAPGPVFWAWLILASLRAAAPVAPCHESVHYGPRELCHCAGIRNIPSGCIHVSDIAFANLRAGRVVVCVVDS